MKLININDLYINDLIFNTVKKMHPLDSLMRDLDTREIEDLVGKLYANRHNTNIFTDIPFRGPNCIPGYSMAAFENHHRHCIQFEEHFQFWEQIMQFAYLGGPTLSLAIDKYVESKSEGHTKDEYKDVETNLIQVVEIQYRYLIERDQQKYNEQGELRFMWKLKCFFLLRSSRHPYLSKRLKEHLTN